MNLESFRKWTNDRASKYTLNNYSNKYVFEFLFLSWNQKKTKSMITSHSTHSINKYATARSVISFLIELKELRLAVYKHLD